jgi:hypothetical protein
VTIGELVQTLDRVRQFCETAGAKTTAKDLKIFSDALKPHAHESVDAFCAEMQARLSDTAERSRRHGKTSLPRATAALHEVAIGRYVAQLRSAATDRQAFDAAFEMLKSDKTVKSADVAEVARRYGNTVTKYKSARAAHADIEKAFLRQARFENKLR